MNLQSQGKTGTTEVLGATQSNPSTKIRQRMGVVTDHKGDPVLLFNNGGVNWMRIRYLVPKMLVEESATVEVTISRGGKVFDRGQFVVDLENRTIKVTCFKHCFKPIFGQAVKRISMTLLEEEDTVLLDGVHDRFYARSRQCANTDAVVSILSLEAMRAAKQRVAVKVAN